MGKTESSVCRKWECGCIEQAVHLSKVRASSVLKNVTGERRRLQFSVLATKPHHAMWWQSAPLQSSTLAIIVSSHKELVQGVLVFPVKKKKKKKIHRAHAHTHTNRNWENWVCARNSKPKSYAPNSPNLQVNMSAECAPDVYVARTWTWIKEKK